jgi:Transposase
MKQQQAIQYLAFDVHQATIVANCRDAEGKVVMRATVATEARAILQLVKSCGPRVHVAFEEGTQAQWLHDLLVPHAEKVVVCNVRGQNEGGNKSDRIDVERLSLELRNGTLKPVFHGTPSMLTLNELVRSYNNLVEDGTRVMQRIKAMFRARAIPTKGTAIYRPGEREQWLGKLENGARVRAAALFKHLEVLLELRPPAKAAMLAEARRQPGWKVLRSIPYLGPVRVAGDHGHHAHPIPLPHQAESLAVRWPGRGDTIEFGSGDRRGPTAQTPAPPSHPRSESQSQPDPQRRLQGRGECGDGTTGTALRLLPGLARTGREGRAGQGHPGQEDRLGHSAAVEERRALGSREIDDASDIASGFERDC